MSFPPRLDIPRGGARDRPDARGGGVRGLVRRRRLRDALLRNPHADLRLRHLGPARGGPASLPPHRRPSGSKHGTVGVIDRQRGLPRGDHLPARDVATDGRHAVVEYGVSLDDDLGRGTSPSTRSPITRSGNECAIRSTAPATWTAAWCAPWGTRPHVSRRTTSAIHSGDPLRRPLRVRRGAEYLGRGTGGRAGAHPSLRRAGAERSGSRACGARRMSRRAWCGSGTRWEPPGSGCPS
jgi:hypothetical protein